MRTTWEDVLKAAEAAAPFLPQPAGAVTSLAVIIARGLHALGCAVSDCPVDLTLQPSDIPTGERGLKFRSKARARGRGLDAKGIADRRKK